MNASRRVLAGWPPAAPKLAPLLSIRRRLHSQSARATRSTPIHTNFLNLTVLQNHLCTPRPLTASPPLPCPNPHSLGAPPLRCDTAGALLPDAISCLGAFRTPAAGARG